MTLFTLTNARGMEVRFASVGGVILSVQVPDRNGAMADVVLGYDAPDDYQTDRYYFGAIVGRYANRIANGAFSIDGHAYALAKNDGPNHLHGGIRGFHRAEWIVEPFTDVARSGAVLSRLSPAGEEGYPGNLQVAVTYTLTDRNELIFDYLATTDAPTPVNLTQHSYFNLAGHDRGDILGHQLTLNASRFTPVNATLIPTGALRAVVGTPFDFTATHAIGARIDVADEQLQFGHGYDHNFVIDRAAATTLTLAARVAEPSSGRMLEVHTTEPGIQLYTGNWLDGSMPGKRGHAYGRRCGLALETQHFPDSPNQEQFPPTILRPGEEYRSRTVYRFMA